MVGRGVPIARRQLLAEPAKLAVSILAIAAAVALVLLLMGLRQGMGEQVTLYLDRQPSVLVGQAGARNFMAQTSVLPETLGERLERVPGVAAATPVSQQFAMLTLHG
ncbi:MAG TPA: ABC transporter permease, partial [Gaiellaceae bacterium]|nr:ABC transporter permease [Gaiellaceae bacterium]